MALLEGHFRTRPSYISHSAGDCTLFSMLRAPALAFLLLLLLLPPSMADSGPRAKAALGPCWRHRDHCLPIPRAMLDLLQVGGHKVVRAVLPTQFGRFPEVGKPKVGPQKHVLTFKIPEAEKGEEFKSAELRLALIWKNKYQKTHGKSKMAHVFLVPKKEECSTKSAIRLDSIPISHLSVTHYNSSLSVKTTTVSFNVTSALFHNQQIHPPSEHFQGPSSLLHLEVHLQSNWNTMTLAIPEEYDQKVNYKNADKQRTEDPPQLLLFYSLGMKSQSSHSSTADQNWRRKRSTKDEMEEETNMIWNGVSEFPRFKEMAGGKKKMQRNPCRRQPLYVDFAEINYDTWIVAPNGYEAYQCVGKCFFPVSEHLSPTKHAILQTLVHSASPRKAARACCVPTRLESISVLFIDHNGVLTYHFNYEDMVVAECGCR